MTDYTKLTDFAAKDALSSGNFAKIVNGTEINTEFANIAVAVATKSNISSPTFTGTLTAPALSITGNTVLGNDASDTITFTGDVASNILPSADDTYDLGATASRWKDIYIDGVAYVDAINLAGTGITATAAELNYTDGVTSNIQTQIDALQDLDADLTAIAALTPTDGNFIVGNGSTWVAESGATVRTSLGLTIGTDVQAYDNNLQSFVTAFTIPTADGTTGQALITDGAGTIAFGNVDALPSQTGNDGYYLSTDGTTASWAEVASLAYVRSTFTATAAQTTFTVAYTVGYADVYMNGVKLFPADFTATNGTSIVLASGAAVGDLVEVVAFNTFNVANALTSANVGVTVQGYDADTTKNDVANTFTANQTFDNGIIEEYNATGASGAVTIDMDTGNNFSTAMAGAVTYTFSNPATSGKVSSFTLKVVNDGNAITWPASVDWAAATAPTLSASPLVDYFVFTTNDGGTTWYGFTAGQAMA